MCNNSEIGFAIILHTGEHNRAILPKLNNV
jgi:hypothetical protein